MSLETTVRLFRTQLFEAFFNWLETNKNAIGKGYDQLYRRGKEAEATCDNAIKIMGTSMWMFNMIAGCGVLAGIGPNNVSVQEINENLDKKSTMRLLHLISACMRLQGLPREIAAQEIPIISNKKFSLKLWVEQHEASREEKT
jgi:hypothetical protein